MSNTWEEKIKTMSKEFCVSSTAKWKHNNPISQLENIVLLRISTEILVFVLKAVAWQPADPSTNRGGREDHDNIGKQNTVDMWPMDLNWSTEASYLIHNEHNTSPAPQPTRPVQSSCFWASSPMVTAVHPSTAPQQCGYLILQLAPFMCGWGL